LSPDGTRIALHTTDDKGRSEIWLYYLDGKTQMQQLAGKGNNSRPIWTREGTRLTFMSDRDGTESIWWQRADGSAPAEKLTHAETGLPHWPDAWSPKGQILAFTKYRQGEQHIWTMSPDEKSEPKMVVGGRDPVQAGGADFSPNGEWIAYRSNENGPHVQVQPFPTTGAFYNIEGQGGAYPVWASQERLIYRRNVVIVNTENPVPGELVTVDLTTNGAPRFGSEQRLQAQGILVFFGSRDYDIALNSPRLLGIFPENQDRIAAAPRPQINVEVNWLRELKSRVPTS
jgi:dipeptidyl aminopeptidase/acylaminoacyl peptidase